jgi:hypothetical protein
VPVYVGGMTSHTYRRIVCTIVMLPAVIGAAQQPESDSVRNRESVANVVAKIQRADYEGDRPALQRLYDDLTPLRDDKQLGPRVRYWQGFALWRKAFNGFNDAPDPKALEPEVQQALGEFQELSRRDPAFVDANVGIISCLQTLLYLNRTDVERVKQLVSQILELFKKSLAIAPENPRLLWVLGVQEWYSPPEQGGGQARAMATFEKGLTSVRQRKGSVKDPLDPSWGEPELLMNLAWAHLNQKPPNVNLAKKYAKQALEIVPYWRYVREILLPKIESAKADQQ